MDPLGFILTALLIITFVAGPLISYVIAQRRKKTAVDPTPKTLERARRQLESVAVIPAAGPSDRQRENVDVEGGASVPDECAICIGPLVPSPVRTSSDNRNHSVFGILPAISTKKETPDEATSSGQGKAGNDIELTEVTSTTNDGAASTSASATASAAAPANPPEEIEDNEIMRLKSCGHAFHARCLVSWFMIERYDCPICRAPYYKTLVTKTRDWRDEHLQRNRTDEAEGQASVSTSTRPGEAV